MISKARSESIELQLLRYLNARLKLSENDLNYYWALEKGYQGEQYFDVLTQNLQGEFLILNDLLFEINNTQFQIDSLLLSSERIYLFDVKNYDGDYSIDADNKWHLISATKKEIIKPIKNPIDQLNRCETLLKQLFQNIGYKSSIVPNLIFINPNFFLYYAPLNLPIIFPPQIGSYFEKLNSSLKKSKLKQHHFTLAQKLISCHLTVSPYIKRPDYTFEGLKKGIFCKSCQSFDINFNSKTILCNKCSSREDMESAVLRNVEEFRILFPDKKITTAIIHEWCGIIKSEITLRKILSANYKRIGKHRGAYYVKLD